jgi:hypothetical protein
MFLHIGGEYTLSKKYIIGIFDFDATTQADSVTIEFLQSSEKKQMIEYVSPDIPRSFILTDDRVYLSPVSASTLRQRMISNDYYKEV